MSRTYLKKLGINIRYARKTRGLSQEKLAELIKKTRNYVGMVERAEINVPVATLIDIAKVLNIHPRNFFEFDFVIEKIK